MIAVALFALALAPAVWMFRRTEALVRQERMAAEYARAAAERAFLYRVQLARNAQAAGKSAQLSTGSQAADSQGNLWAAVSVNRSIFEQGKTKELKIEFTLINDGAEETDPKIAESSIIVNGEESLGSGSILRSALPDAQVRPLPPRGKLQFGVGLGDRFQEPGIYRVSWRGEQFQSPDVVIRVLPLEAR
jgi:hypothetical protein